MPPFPCARSHRGRGAGRRAVQLHARQASAAVSICCAPHGRFLAAGETATGPPPGPLRNSSVSHPVSLDRPDEVFISYMELRNLTPENFAVIEDAAPYEDQSGNDLCASGVSAGDFAVRTPRSRPCRDRHADRASTHGSAQGRRSLDQVRIYWDMVRNSLTSGQAAARPRFSVGRL